MSALSSSKTRRGRREAGSSRRVLKPHDEIAAALHELYAKELSKMYAAWSCPSPLLYALDMTRKKREIAEKFPEGCIP